MTTITTRQHESYSTLPSDGGTESKHSVYSGQFIVSQETVQCGKCLRGMARMAGETVIFVVVVVAAVFETGSLCVALAIPELSL